MTIQLLKDSNRWFEAHSPYWLAILVIESSYSYNNSKVWINLIFRVMFSKKNILKFIRSYLKYQKKYPWVNEVDFTSFKKIFVFVCWIFIVIIILHVILFFKKCGIKSLTRNLRIQEMLTIGSIFLTLKSHLCRLARFDLNQIKQFYQLWYSVQCSCKKMCQKNKQTNKVRWHNIYKCEKRWPLGRFERLRRAILTS